jgi:hypothetical protein
MLQNIEYIAGGLTILTLFVTVIGQYYKQKHQISTLEEIRLEHESRISKTEEAIMTIQKNEAASMETRKNMEKILQENRNDIKFLTKEITAISGMLSIVVKDKSSQ